MEISDYGAARPVDIHKLQSLIAVSLPPGRSLLDRTSSFLTSSLCSHVSFISGSTNLTILRARFSRPPLPTVVATSQIAFQYSDPTSETSGLLSGFRASSLFRVSTADSMRAYQNASCIGCHTGWIFVSSKIDRTSFRIERWCSGELRKS